MFPPHSDVDLIACILGLALLVGIGLVIPFSSPEPPPGEAAASPASPVTMVFADTGRIWRTAAWLQLPAAVAAVLSFHVPTGGLAAALTLPWAIECGLLALWGAVRLLPHNVRPVEEVLVSVGLMYLPVGGAWLLGSRLGHGFLGFTEPLVLLTAIHFHYAGCLAPSLTGAIGRALRPGHQVYRILAIGVALGPPLVALGINTSNWMEPVAGAVLGTCLLGVAGLAAVVVMPRLARVARAPLLVSALCGFGALVLAVLYALRDWLPALSLPQMIRTHGVLNSLGFTVTGLAAMGSYQRTRLTPLPPFSRLRARGRLGPDFFKRHGLIDPSRTSTGLIDDFDTYFEPGLLSPEIRQFYEHTATCDMEVEARWAPLFSWVGHVYKHLGDRLEQMNFPGPAQGGGDSRIVPLSDARDGRTQVRAWVRTYRSTGKSLYVAAYSSHVRGGVRYMNIAFPWPGGNVTSILRLNQTAGVLTLSTLGDGDQGVYGVNPWLPVRLPMNEKIDVWRAAPGQLAATHQVWWCGLPLLTLHYQIKVPGDTSQSPR